MEVKGAQNLSHECDDQGLSVHVVMRHAIVEVPCVNVVIGVHTVVLCVLLVVVRVVPIFLAVIL